MAQIAFKGNASGEPELKFWDDGSATAKVSVAENHWKKNRQTDEFEQTGTTWWNVQVSGREAETFAQQVKKGTRLTVVGRVSSRSYEKDGEKRTWTQVNVDSYGITPSNDQQSGGYSQQGGYGGQADQSYSRPSGQSQAPQNDPWGGGYDQGAPF